MSLPKGNGSCPYIRRILCRLYLSTDCFLVLAIRYLKLSSGCSNLDSPSPHVFFRCTPEAGLTDACLSGWGAVLQNRMAKGQWSAQEHTQYINSLELRTVTSLNPVTATILNPRTLSTCVQYQNRCWLNSVVQKTQYVSLCLQSLVFCNPSWTEDSLLTH